MNPIVIASTAIAGFCMGTAANYFYEKTRDYDKIICNALENVRKDSKIREAAKTQAKYFFVGDVLFSIAWLLLIITLNACQLTKFVPFAIFLFGTAVGSMISSIDEYLFWRQ